MAIRWHLHRQRHSAPTEGSERLAIDLAGLLRGIGAMVHERQLKPFVRLLGVSACAGVLAFAAMSRDAATRQPGAEIAMAVSSGSALVLATKAEPPATTSGTNAYICANVVRLGIADLGFRCRPLRTKTATAPIRR